MLLTTLLLLILAGTGPQGQPAAALNGLMHRLLSFEAAGDWPAAEKLVRSSGPALDKELSAALEEIDHDFDELGRQKARSDLLQEKFQDLNEKLRRYEKIYELHSRISRRSTLWKRFQGRKWRVEGAYHTTNADALWDRQEYAGALEEYRLAMARLQSAVPLAREAKDQKLTASCLSNIAYVDINTGNADEALRHYTRALKIADQRGDPVYRGLYLLNLGTFYLHTGKADTSLRYSLDAAEMTLKSQRKTWEANALLNAGAAHFQLGQTENAQGYLERALKKSEEANDRRSHGRALYNLALTNGQAKKNPDAARLMEEALEWYERNTEVYSRAEQTLARYQGMAFLVQMHRRLDNPEQEKRFSQQLAELRRKEGEKLAVYQADPHSDFTKWPEFRLAHPSR